MDLIDFDPYEWAMLGTGLALALGVWLPQLLVKRHFTIAIIYVLAGFLFFKYFLIEVPNPYSDIGQRIWEKLAEFLVILSLLGAGLKIDTPLTSGQWKITARLLFITMPLCILAGAWLGHWMLGLAPAAAVLLGAVLAPTDPVLASDVQVGPPNEQNDKVRFALTSEAGVNDGLAFPFTYFAIRMAEAGGLQSEWLVTWLWQDVLYKIGVGVLAGVLMGRVLAFLVFKVPKERPVFAEGMGSVALCVLFISYAGAEAIGGYGFLSVFAAAYFFRRSEHAHKYNIILHEFTYNLEHIVTALLLIFMGGLVAFLLPTFTLEMLWYGLVFIFIVRPLLAWISLMGARIWGSRRLIVSVFGIRGIGSIYYLAYALANYDFGQGETLWGTVLVVIMVSVVVHGFSAYPVMNWLDRRYGYTRPATEIDQALDTATDAGEKAEGTA
ncbi:cation:proton antiporter [Cesiribacter andamanensis]|uniref:cation:proton antiporter n=1 Tax=Cesiribacter andamanensis TaxID=649507 RepID=UPI00034B4E5A|nr:cation:proton antiporter [Cesiribacter andamanensis]